MLRPPVAAARRDDAGVGLDRPGVVVLDAPHVDDRATPGGSLGNPPETPPETLPETPPETQPGISPGSRELEQRLREQAHHTRRAEAPG